MPLPHLASSPGEASRPASPCAVIEVRGRDLGGDRLGELARQVQAALMGGAPVVLVLRASTESLTHTRAQLHAIDAAMRATTERQSARVSRSATDGLAAWAASTAGPIGVDVQAAPHRIDDALVDCALQPDEVLWMNRQPEREHAFAQLWAGKEAVLKAFGVGLAWSPRAIAALPASSTWHAIHVHALGHAWLSHPPVPGAPSFAALAVAINAGHAPLA